jgi:hypothetical protein
MLAGGAWLLDLDFHTCDALDDFGRPLHPTVATADPDDTVLASSSETIDDANADLKFILPVLTNAALVTFSCRWAMGKESLPRFLREKLRAILTRDKYM